MADAVMIYASGKTHTEATVEETYGRAFTMTVRCSNSMNGCDLEHVYFSERCRRALATVAPEGWAPLRHVASGETAVVILCGSDHWLDGVRVAASVEESRPVARIFYQQNEAPRRPWSRLPFSPVIALGESLEQSTAVSMSRRQHEDGGATTAVEGWSAGQSGSRSETPCARRVGASPGARALWAEEAEEDDDTDDDDTDDDDAWTEELARASGVMCYQLRIESLTTLLEVEPAYTLPALLDDWGGAYALVFGTCSLVLCALDAMRRRGIGMRQSRNAHAFQMHVDPPVEDEQQKVPTPGRTPQSIEVQEACPPAVKNAQ